MSATGHPPTTTSAIATSPKTALDQPSASTSAGGASARIASSKLRSPARQAVYLQTRVVSAVRGRQGSGKVERRSSPGQPEGSVWLEAHIYCWQEGKSELVDEVCVCRGGAVRLHSPPDGERRVVTSGPPFLRHLPCPPQLRHLPCWPLPCHMPPHSSGHRSMQRPGIPRLHSHTSQS